MAGARLQAVLLYGGLLLQGALAGVCNINTTSAPWDAAACREQCPACFAGPEWDALKAELGVTDAMRAQRRLEMPDGCVVLYQVWASAQMVAHAVNILLDEFMGFDTRPRVDSDPLNALACVASRQVTIVPEYWYYDVRGQSYTHEQLDVSSAGYMGRSGLYVPAYTTEDQYCLSSWQALRHWLHHVPPDGAAPCEAKLANASRVRCDGDARFLCMTPEVWGGNVSCERGRFVPPQCRTPDRAFAPHCGEVLMAFPEWSTSWWEAAVVNLGLNLTMAYLGPRLSPVVEQQVAARVPTMFYGYEPDILMARLAPTMVLFPPRRAPPRTPRTPSPAASTATRGRRRCRSSWRRGRRRTSSRSGRPSRSRTRSSRSCCGCTASGAGSWTAARRRASGCGGTRSSGSTG